MCKVAIIPAIKKPSLTATFIKHLGARMSIGNNDGLGYAAINESGELFGERWFVNSDAFINQKEEKPNAALMSWGKALKTLPAVTSKYNKFGTGDLLDAKAITLHTRMATCEKNLNNVHPFVDEDTSVIHNGVIRNDHEFDLKLSTCDSESILISYLENGVNKDITSVQDMVDALQGYYACGVFSRDNEGNRILDVFKHNNNNLVISFINELETYVLTSSALDIKMVCDMMKLTYTEPIDIENNFITRLQPFTGEVIEQATFTNPVFTTQAHTYPKSTYEGYNVYNPAAKKVNPEMVKLWMLPSSISEIHD